MPESPEIDLDKLEGEVKGLIEQHKGNFKDSSKEPVGFGLTALIFVFSRDESLGSTDDIEEDINSLDDVSAVEILSVSRALG